MTIRNALAVSCLVLFMTAGCAHRVYTERYEPEPVVVQRTVVVERRPHYYYHPRPYPARVVVVSPRPTYRHDYRRDDRSGATVRARSGDVHFHAEASAR